MSQNLTTNILTQIAYKRLSGKAMSSGRLSLADEALGSTVQSSATTIFGQVVPNAPVSASDGSSIYKIQSASASDPGTVQLVKFDLTVVPNTSYGTDITGMNIDALKKDPSGTQAARTISPIGGFDQGIGQAGSTDTFHAYSISLPSDYVASSNAVGFSANASTPKTLGTDAPFTNGFMSTGSVQMQVVPEFLSTITGTSNTYIPKVIATDGSVMSTNSVIDYYFDAMAGILFVQDPQAAAGTAANAAVPEFIEAFLYVGRYQSEIEGDSVDLHFSASEGTGFSFANNATASFTSGSGGGLTVEAGVGTNNIEFTLVNVISSSAQLPSFHVSASTSTADFDISLGETASFINGGAGLTVETVAGNKVQIGKTTDNVTFNQITGSDLIITNTASISYLETIYETASVIYTSGSTKFGNSLDDFHNFTGSIELSSSGVDGFTWDTPEGSTVTIPLVYDATNKRVLTGSDYFRKTDPISIHLSASEGTGFNITNLSTASFTSGSGGGLTVTAGTLNNIEFELVGVVSSSDQILDGTGILSSSTQDFVTYSSSVSSSIATNITNIATNTGNINVNATDIDFLEASASAGIHFNTGSSAAGGTSISLTDTASFVGGAGITTAIAGDVITISSDVGELTSPVAISASNGITSLDYGGTASFTSSGAGLSVGQTAGTVTYTITPDAVLNGATDTTTFDFTSSNAVTASYAENAGSVTIVDNENTNSDRAIVFANPATGNAQLQTDNSTFRYNPFEAKIMVGDATTNITSISASGDIVQEGSSTTSNIFNTVVTTMNIGGVATSINMGAASGFTNILGSASIAGDLIVNGTTTTINTDTLLVEDKYILLASGAASAGGGTNSAGGGIVVERSAQNIGTSLHWDEAKAVWAVDVAGADATSTGPLTAQAAMVFASHSSGTPSGTPLVGAAGSPNYRLGQMYLDTADTDSDGNTIWIYAT